MAWKRTQHFKSTEMKMQKVYLLECCRYASKCKPCKP